MAHIQEELHDENDTKQSLSSFYQYQASAVGNKREKQDQGIQYLNYKVNDLQNKLDPKL